jgi:hypothetical protein
MLVIFVPSHPEEASQHPILDRDGMPLHQFDRFNCLENQFFLKDKTGINPKF